MLHYLPDKCYICAARLLAFKLVTLKRWRRFVIDTVPGIFSTISSRSKCSQIGLTQLVQPSRMSLPSTYSIIRPRRGGRASRHALINLMPALARSQTSTPFMEGGLLDLSSLTPDCELENTGF